MVDSLVDKVGIRSCAGWPRFEIGRATDVAIANDLQGRKVYQQSHGAALVDELKTTLDSTEDFAD